MDPEARCSIDYGVAGVPETFFIDSAGIIHEKLAVAVDAGLLARSVGPLLDKP